MPKIRPGILGVPRSAGYPRSSSAPMKQPGDSGGDRASTTSSERQPVEWRADGHERSMGADAGPTARPRQGAETTTASTVLHPRRTWRLHSAHPTATGRRRAMGRSRPSAMQRLRVGRGPTNGQEPVLQQSRAPEPGEPAIYRAHRPDRYTDLRASAPIGCRHRWLRGRDTSVNDPGQHTSRRSPGPGGECWEAVAEDGGVGDPHTL